MNLRVSQSGYRWGQSRLSKQHATRGAITKEIVVDHSNIGQEGGSHVLDLRERLKMGARSLRMCYEYRINGDVMRERREEIEGNNDPRV